jgi:hypothetical protein
MTVIDCLTRRAESPDVMGSSGQQNQDQSKQSKRRTQNGDETGKTENVICV